MKQNLDLLSRPRLQQKHRFAGTRARCGKLERVTERLHLSVWSLAHAVDKVVGSGSDVVQFPLQRIEKRWIHIDSSDGFLRALIGFDDSRPEHFCLCYR